MKQRPNIILVLADDLGYGDIGAFGNDVVRTPNIDDLAATGMAFTQHYSASGLCAPARAALLTGLYNHRTGAVDVPSNRGLDRIHLDCRTMGDVFTAAGYRTGLIGKWHNGLHDLRHHPNNRGFGEFAGFLNGGMDYYDWVLDRNGQPEPADGRYLTDVFTDEAVAFIRRHRAEPFFLILSYNAPHEPHQAPEALIQPYREVGHLTEQVATVYAMIEQMDAGIGNVRRELARQGLDETTIIVFTSDNGPRLDGPLNRYNGPCRGAKGDSLEGGIRVPAIVRWPDNVPAGRHCDAMVHFCDWLPTLASLANTRHALPEPLDGTDISPLLLNPERNVALPRIRCWQRNRYEPVPRCNAAMRDGPWKLVWPMRDGANGKEPDDGKSYRDGLTSAHRLMPVTNDLPGRDIAPPSEPQLYHIESDPAESRDVAAEHKQRVNDMANSWDAWFEDVTREWKRIYRENTAEPPAGSKS